MKKEWINLEKKKKERKKRCIKMMEGEKQGVLGTEKSPVSRFLCKKREGNARRNSGPGEKLFLETVYAPLRSCKLKAK